MLETLGGDRQNIKRLVLTDPGPNLVETFDVEKDITYIEWNKVKGALEAGSSTSRTARLAASANILDRDRFKTFNFSPVLSKIEESAVTAISQSYTRPFNVGMLLNLLAYSQMIKPDSIKQLTEKYPDLQWGVLSKAPTLPEGQLKEVARVSSFMIAFAPDKPEVIENLFDRVFSQKSIKQTTAYGGIKLLSRFMAMARIGFPDRSNELPLQSSDWPKMRQHLEDLRSEGDPYNFTQHAFHMYILAAQEVKVTPDQGLVIVPQPKSFSLIRDSIVLPSQRRF